VSALETAVYESLMHSSVAAAYDDVPTAAQKAKKSLSAWSLATKLTGSHISLSNKHKKPPAEDSHGSNVLFLYIDEFNCIK